MDGFVIVLRTETREQIEVTTICDMHKHQINLLDPLAALSSCPLYLALISRCNNKI